MFKRCPHCGETAILMQQTKGLSRAIWWVVECTRCKASTAAYLSQESAIEAWSKRIKYNHIDY